MTTATAPTTTTPPARVLSIATRAAYEQRIRELEEQLARRGADTGSGALQRTLRAVCGQLGCQAGDALAALGRLLAERDALLRDNRAMAALLASDL